MPLLGWLMTGLTQDPLLVLMVEVCYVQRGTTIIVERATGVQSIAGLLNLIFAMYRRASDRRAGTARNVHRRGHVLGQAAA